MAQARADLAPMAQLARLHEVAAQVRGVLANPSATVSDVLAARNQLPQGWRPRFWMYFAQLYGGGLRRFPSSQAFLLPPVPAAAEAP